MILTLSQALALAMSCAPAIAPQTLLSVAKAESGLDPLAIGVNASPPIRVRATTPTEAAQKAAALIAAGFSVDLGLAQINSGNLGPLGLSVEAAFDPCRNLAAAAKLLQAGYRRAHPQTIGEQAALRRALSDYNTGDQTRGLTNGYVQRVQAAAARLVPALALEGALSPSAPSPALAPAPSPPAWDVFGQTSGDQDVLIRVQTPKLGAPQ